MGRKRRRNSMDYFEESLYGNERAYWYYVDRLMELSIAMFKWTNLPEFIDERFMELTLFTDGQLLFFKDEDIDAYFALQFASSGEMDIYKVPIVRDVYAVNGYNRTMYNYDSVIIWNNYLRKSSINNITYYAHKLYSIDRCIDVNVNGQKTPIVLQCSENQRLSLLNLFKEYNGNAPVIFSDKNLDLNGLKSITTGVPYVSDKLYDLKINIWNEALTYLGIPNVSIQKKERLVSDEVNRTMGGVIASRYSRINARKQACDQINKMFGLNVQCEVREFTDIPTDGMYREDFSEQTVGMYREGDADE